MVSSYNTLSANSLVSPIGTQQVAETTSVNTQPIQYRSILKKSIEQKQESTTKTVKFNPLIRKKRHIKENNAILSVSANRIIRACNKLLKAKAEEVDPIVLKYGNRRLLFLSRSLAASYEFIYWEHATGVDISKLDDSEKRSLFNTIYNAMQITTNKMLKTDDISEDDGFICETTLEKKHGAIIETAAMAGVETDLLKRLGLA